MGFKTPNVIGQTLVAWNTIDNKPVTAVMARQPWALGGIPLGSYETAQISEGMVPLQGYIARHETKAPLIPAGYRLSPYGNSLGFKNGHPVVRFTAYTTTPEPRRSGTPREIILDRTSRAAVKREFHSYGYTYPGKIGRADARVLSTLLLPLQKTSPEKNKPLIDIKKEWMGRKEWSVLKNAIKAATIFASRGNIEGTDFELELAETTAKKLTGLTLDYTVVGEIKAQAQYRDDLKNEAASELLERALAQINNEQTTAGNALTDYQAGGEPQIHSGFGDTMEERGFYGKVIPGTAQSPEASAKLAAGNLIHGGLILYGNDDISYPNASAKAGTDGIELLYGDAKPETSQTARDSESAQILAEARSETLQSLDARIDDPFSSDEQRLVAMLEKSAYLEASSLQGVRPEHETQSDRGNGNTRLRVEKSGTSTSTGGDSGQEGQQNVRVISPAADQAAAAATALPRQIADETAIVYLRGLQAGLINVIAPEVTGLQYAAPNKEKAPSWGQIVANVFGRIRAAFRWADEATLDWLGKMIMPGVESRLLEQDKRTVETLKGLVKLLEEDDRANRK